MPYRVFINTPLKAEILQRYQNLVPLKDIFQQFIIELANNFQRGTTLPFPHPPNLFQQTFEIETFDGRHAVNVAYRVDDLDEAIDVHDVLIVKLDQDGEPEEDDEDDDIPF